jgi:hypothetical protein
MRQYEEFDYSSISEIDWARLAAYVDGEGSITIIESGRKRSHPFRDVRVIISQSDVRLMAWLQSIWGGAVSQHKGVNRPCYNWAIGGRRVEVILARIRQYLIVKPEQADIGMAYRATMTRSTRRLSPEVIEQRKLLREQMFALKPTQTGAKASRMVRGVQ